MLVKPLFKPSLTNRVTGEAESGTLGLATKLELCFRASPLQYSQEYVTSSLIFDITGAIAWIGSLKINMDDNWVLCWKIDLHFHRRTTYPSVCLICAKTVGSGSYVSTFVQEATECRRHEQIFPDASGPEKKSICSFCNKDLLLNVTLRKQKCFSSDCGCFASVKEKIVRAKVDEEKLLEEYIALLEKYRVFHCGYCMDDESLNDAPKTTPTSKCKHDISLCREGLEALLENKVNSGGWESIDCPDPSCKEVLTAGDVQRFATRQAYLKYEELVTQKNMSKLRGFRWCAGNSFECKAGQLNPGTESNPKWQCKKPSCKAENCFNCRSLWHVGRTCRQNRLMQNLDPATQEALLRTTKGCPKRDCGRRIEKHFACPDVFCAREAGGCGTHFCWNCKVIYEESGKPHLGTCRFKALYSTCRVIPKPSAATNSSYAEGWDQDPKYVPPADEYTWSYTRY